MSLMFLLKTLVTECNLRSRWQEYFESNLCIQRIVIIETVLCRSISHWRSGIVVHTWLQEQFLMGGVCLETWPWWSSLLPLRLLLWTQYVQLWVFIELPGLWWPYFILLNVVWLPLSGKPDLSKEDPPCALRFHSESMAENTWDGQA